MKQKDITLIIVVVAVSGLVSFFVARAVFVKSTDRKMEAEVVAPITNEFARPSKKYFNEASINPTREIEIGNSGNNAPYTGAQ